RNIARLEFICFTDPPLSETLSGALSQRTCLVSVSEPDLFPSDAQRDGERAPRLNAYIVTRQSFRQRALSDARVCHHAPDRDVWTSTIQGFGRRFQSRTASSMPALANVRSSGEKARAERPLRWPRRLVRSFPVAASHNFTVSSALPVARVRLSEENVRH